ncbi:MAG TPA: MFS transporter, partial [Steroidobacteraceae bacterium]|nr:MFS transporter [Steroidobacteraceae bacterium]
MPASRSAPAPTVQAPSGLPRRLAVHGLVALTIVNLLNYLDRYVISALLPDLRGAPMHLTDTRAGALMTGFLLVYLCASPLFGALGDRGARIRPLAVGVLLWSLATGLSGMARNYLQLLASRAAVGIGEAAYGTIAPALLADYFPLGSRSRVLAVFGMAIPVGAALGYVVGGLVDHWYGWRAAFYVAGVPGLLLALWISQLPDPPRGAQERTSPRDSERTGLALYAGLMRAAPYRLTVLGYAAYTFAVGGLAYWMPTFLQSTRGVPAAQASTGFGAIVVVTGFVGTLAGGWLGDYCLRYSREAYLWLSALVTLLAVPFASVALTARDPHIFYPAIVLAELLLFMSSGPVNSAIINLAAPAERASAVALSVFLIHLLGDVPSPLLIGMISDAAHSLAIAVQIVP